MSDHGQMPDLNAEELTVAPGSLPARLPIIGLILGLVGLGASALLAGSHQQEALYSYLVAFLFFRLVLPFVTFGGAFLYLFVLRDMQLPPVLRLTISFAAAYFGFYLPNIFIHNLIQRRQQSIKRAFPDALDLLLICVQAGMSIEAAFNKVATEIGARSLELAEEFSLTTAELSYLPDRHKAYENFGKRTGLPGVKSVGTALVQAERYGTSIGTALRTMAQENRDMRMAEAEKKAASLPPKLTVPMIVFFLPVLFIVILGPAYIKVMAVRGG